MATLSSGRRWACALLVGLATGCTTIRYDAPRYSPAAFPSRDAARHSPWSGGSDNPAYQLIGHDELELRLEGSAATFGLRGLDAQDEAIQIFSNVRVARLTLGTLREINRLEIRVTGMHSATTIGITLPTSGITWSDVRSLFSGQTAACGDSKNCPIGVSLVPRTPLVPKPGDRIVLERTYVPTTGGSTGLIVAQSFAVTVDPEGYLAVPLLPAINGRWSDLALRGEHVPLGSPPESVGQPDLRRIGAQIENSYARIRVWAPHWVAEMKPTLDAVSECLSAATALPAARAYCTRDHDFDAVFKLPKDFSSSCGRLDIDDRFRSCFNVTQAVHYRLRAAAVGWTLVDESDCRHEVPWRQGMTVAAAAAEAYLQYHGRPLVQSQGRRRLYLVLNGEASSQSADRFFVELGRSVAPDADPRLLPNDTVFVTGWRPGPR